MIFGLTIVLCIIGFIGYIKTLKKTIDIQDKVINDQKNLLFKKEGHIKEIEDKLFFYKKTYFDLCSGMSNVNKPPIVIEYELDDILQEISKKGIDNIDKDKLEFLKKFSKK